MQTWMTNGMRRVTVPDLTLQHYAISCSIDRFTQSDEILSPDSLVDMCLAAFIRYLALEYSYK